jgi:hypothetical protein
MKNCVMEVVSRKEVVPAIWKVSRAGFDPRANCIQFLAGKEDHPHGLSGRLPKKPRLLVGSLYFEWLREENLQKVKFHLVRELKTKEVNLAESVNEWLKRKLDELWDIVEDPVFDKNSK